MKWKRISDYSIQSDCGRYNVNKVGSGSETRYEPWFLGEPKGPMRKAADPPFTDPALAKEHCAKHAQAVTA